MRFDDQELDPLGDQPLGKLDPTGNRFERLTPEAWQQQFRLYLETPDGRLTHQAYAQLHVNRTSNKSPISQKARIAGRFYGSE